jgi:DNA helicase HerA-like ATPase
MSMQSPNSESTDLGSNGTSHANVLRVPDNLLAQLQGDVDQAGGEVAVDLDRAGAIGATMFDLPGSEDQNVTVLLPRENAQRAPSQSLVRIKSRDGKSYLGVVAAGPFAEPDSLRADSHLLVAVTANGGVYLPPYHGRIQVTIMGEELADGTLAPPRLRPLPNSAVFALTDAESAKIFHAGGDIRLGLGVGIGKLEIGVPSTSKQVLPRHTAILGTTGSGKSTTVAGLVREAQAAGVAVILLDVEGEYTFLHEQTDKTDMLSGLKERGLPHDAVPVDKMTVYHLTGRETTNPGHPNRREFSLQFGRLSPYTVMEMIGANDAQEERFWCAYEIGKRLLRDLGIFPQKTAADGERERQERILLRLDEFERGYPRLTLSFFLDVVGLCKAKVAKSTFTPFNSTLKTDEAKRAIESLIEPKQMPGNAASWGKLLSLLWRINRLKVFDRPAAVAPVLKYADLIRPGTVSIIDLSDTGMTELTNLAIADLLRGVQEAQEGAYQVYEKAKAGNIEAPLPPRTLLILEEAHEFLSEERIRDMQILFQQVSRLARRGRKRWLGLTFVTQLPQHLPRQVLGLVNGYILHKIADPQVVATLRKTISGIDEALWTRLPGLAPGQAVVSFPHMAKPLLVSIDPTPCKLRLVD